MSRYVHPQGICESESVGEGTRVWAFAHVLPGAIIGRDCNICDHVFVENDVVVGDRVTVKCGVQLWDGLRVQDDVFIGPNATFTNDKYPRSKVYPQRHLETHVERHSSIGANAVILPGLRVGAYAMIGAGAVVTRDVPPYAHVVGNPARIVGYSTTAKPAAPPAGGARAPSKRVESTGVRGVTVHRFPRFRDLRGRLTVANFGDDLPFKPERFFVVYGVESQYIRGEHAHRRCHQFLMCLSGSVRLVVDDGTDREEIVLNRPHLGVYMPPMIWGTQYRYTRVASMLVFASLPYDPGDYIRSYEEFKALAAGPSHPAGDRPRLAETNQEALRNGE